MSRSNRGRHKSRRSPETQRWNALEPELQQHAWIPPAKPKRPKLGPPPKRPSYLDAETYAGLVQLRRTLERTA